MQDVDESASNYCVGSSGVLGPRQGHGTTSRSLIFPAECFHLAVVSSSTLRAPVMHRSPLAHAEQGSQERQRWYAASSGCPTPWWEQAVMRCRRGGADIRNLVDGKAHEGRWPPFLGHEDAQLWLISRSPYEGDEVARSWLPGPVDRSSGFIRPGSRLERPVSGLGAASLHPYVHSTPPKPGAR